MKKSYKKILFIENLLLVLLLINSFKKSFLQNYFICLFLFLSILLFRLIFGFENHKKENLKKHIIQISIYLIIVVLVYYLFGLITGFAHNNLYYNFYSFYTFILPIIITAILSEFLRYQLLRKSEGNVFLIIYTTLIFILISISNSIYYTNFDSIYNIIVFVGITLLPSISTNILGTYINIKIGYKPMIFYLIVFNLLNYLLPIIPDYNEFLVSIFNLLVPTILLYIIMNSFNDELQKELEFRTSKKKEKVLLVLTSIICITTVYFTCGYFKFYAIAIASGSMSPTFNKGDIVVIEKIKNKKQQINVGDIIAYDYDNKIIVHRLIKIININGEKFYYTKGDANNSIDNYKIKREQIRGTVKLYIPFLGYPTVWLSELD